MNRPLKFLQRVGLLVGSGVLVLCLVPATAHAGVFDIFGVIDNLLQGQIGGTLTLINGIQNSVRNLEEQVLYPVALVNQTHNYVNTVKASYRSWMGQVFNLRINSAQLPQNQSLENILLSNASGSIPNLAPLYSNSYGELPDAMTSPLATRQMMDIDDANARDAVAQSVASDQATANLISIAHMLEDESAVTAPGTADMVAASGRAAELQSLATQHRLLASMLREEAGALAHRNAIRKQSVQQTQRFNSGVQSLMTSR